MEDQFIEQLYLAHRNAVAIPSPDRVCDWLEGLLKLLFPELSERTYHSQREFKQHYNSSKLELARLLETVGPALPMSVEAAENAFLEVLPEVHSLLIRDSEAILAGDPAASSQTEVIRTYPGFYAICVYRLAHEFYNLGIPLIPRILTEHAHSRTGIDIHPAARIGERCCIDHGTGLVVGETVVIGNQVKLYHGVTLGALSVKKEMAKTKRHPTIEDRVVIYAGATILGGETVIGHDSMVGGNAWITQSVPPFSRIYYQQEGRDAMSGVSSNTV